MNSYEDRFFIVFITLSITCMIFCFLAMNYYAIFPTNLQLANPETLHNLRVTVSLIWIIIGFLILPLLTYIPVIDRIFKKLPSLSTNHAI